MIAEPPVSTSDLLGFFEANPEVVLEETAESYIVKNPWRDDTVVIDVKKDNAVLIEGLNSVRLPVRFSAIWHRSSGDLEFIFGPVRSQNPVVGRKFSFYFKGEQLECEYAHPSEALEQIAYASRPQGAQTDTAHRNIPAFRAFKRIAKVAEEKGEEVSVQLLSFFIRGVKFSEDALPELANHVNFYMSYFDRKSPKILIHDEPAEERSAEEIVRNPVGNFPGEIVARKLDPYLLVLWETGSVSKDPLRQIIANYQILEYASFYYLREELVQSVRKLIGSPDILGRIDRISREILDVVVEDRMSDEAKITAVINQVVDPAQLWAEIEPRKEFFSSETKFDGGYVQPPLIKCGWTLSDFQAAWTPKVADALRKLRNALVHAREQRLSRCIAPTSRNQHLLRPWSALAASIGYQVLLYGGFE